MSRGIYSSHRQILSLISELSRAVRCCQQEEAFCENVTFTQFVILEAVGKTGTLRLSDLHGILVVEKSTTTRLVDPLVNRGLIVREKSLQDSRAVTLKLTDEGKTVLRRVWDCLSRALNAIEVELPEDNRGEIYKAVRVFSQAVEKACAAGACDRR
jgi:DNA-binding MarR family transcriptional regulator